MIYEFEENTSTYDFIKTAVKGLVRYPEEVELTESESERGSYVYTISVVPEDMGFVIGRKGSVINALIRIATALQDTKGRKIHIRLNE
jgi:predicted RNA-binding protein YlqC (UPF0109 family)